MLGLLRALGGRRSKGRALLSVAGIALGVALGYAVWLVNEAAVADLAAAVRALAGESDLQVRGGRGGFSEELYPQVARLPGVAVVSPIAPFDETRKQVRAMVEEAGGAFFLVHVATTLEECERRDRKGLYAKARAGEIPEFTGISSPYEEPEDADVRVDTTGRTIEDALGDVLDALRAEGYLDLR